MDGTQKIKGFQTQIAKLKSEIELLRFEIAEKQKSVNQKAQSIQNLNIEIKKLSTSDNIKVSEHAMLRYFERVRGFNLQDIEKEILTDEVIRLSKTLGNGSFPCKGFNVLIKDKTVVTITNT